MAGSRGRLASSERAKQAGGRLLPFGPEQITVDLDQDAREVAAINEVNDSLARWGVRLSDAELVEMDRRIAMETAMPPLARAAEDLPGYAGHWIDQAAGGEIVVGVRHGREEARTRLASLVPAGARLRVDNVEHSLAELRAVEARIKADWDAETLPAENPGHLFVDISQNTVVLAILDPAKFTAALRARYGETIRVEHSNPVPTGCSSRENCYDPLNGGRWVMAGISGAPAGTSLTHRCSLAFQVEIASAGSSQWLTAGHCAKTLNVAWYHAANANWPLGTIRKTCWPTCNVSDAARGGWINTDVSYRIYYTSGLDVPGWPVFGTQAFDGDDEGQIVCLSGRKAAAIRCGEIESIGRMTYGSVYFDEQRFASYASQYGDSGGGTHSALVANGVRAYGVASGCTNLNAATGVCEGLAVYSHIFRVAQELGVTVCTTANSCP